MDEAHNTFKYNYRFLYQSIAVYATTLASYILVRGLLIEKEFAQIFRDPVVYLLCAIIIFSSMAVIYNAAMRRRIEIAKDKIYLRGALREVTIDIASVRNIRIGIEHQRGFIPNTRIIKIHLKDRRRPAWIRTYNFERSEELYQAIKKWGGDLLLVRPHRKRRRSA
ncbi:MAG: hypothetical protein Q8916_00305 [Bacteroidota bacterium]|nr:hypothetical protein [Bacteroidota bacterium]